MPDGSSLDVHSEENIKRITTERGLHWSTSGDEGIISFFEPGTIEHNTIGQDSLILFTKVEGGYSFKSQEDMMRFMGVIMNEEKGIGDAHDPLSIN